MKISRKYISLAAAAMIIVSMSLAGCTGMPWQTGEDQTESKETSESDVTKAADETDGEDVTDVEIESQTLIDNDSCSVVITDIIANGDADCTIKLELNNKSADKTLIFASKYAVVEGLSVDPHWSCVVSPSSASNAQIDFYADDIYADDIGYSDIAIMMVVYDMNNTKNVISEQYIRIYPYGQENVSAYQRTSGDQDVILAENELVKVTAIGLAEDETWGQSVRLYIENKTENDLQFVASNVSVNGKMADPSWGVVIPANASGYSAITWSDELLSENGITNIENISLTLIANNYNDWTSKPVVSAEIVYAP